MLVCVYRPEREHRCWQIGVQAARRLPGRHAELRLQELSPEETRSLVASLLGVHSLSPALREVVLRKCSGNPFFLEEVVRSLIETGAIYRSGDTWTAQEGIEEIPVPETVQSVIQTRVDRLAPGLKAEAFAPDGQVEAASMPDATAFLLGVQWHPEWQHGENRISRAIFNAFGEALRTAHSEP